MGARRNPINCSYDKSGWKEAQWNNLSSSIIIQTYVRLFARNERFQTKWFYKLKVWTR